MKQASGLRNKRVAVLGGSSGIGFAVAEQASTQGGIGLATAPGQVHRRRLIHKEYAKTRTRKARLAHDSCRCSGSPAAVTLSISMKHLKVENNHRGAFRIRARTPPKG